MIRRHKEAESDHKGSDHFWVPFVKTENIKTLPADCFNLISRSPLINTSNLRLNHEKLTRVGGVHHRRIRNDSWEIKNVWFQDADDVKLAISVWGYPSNVVFIGANDCHQGQRYVHILFSIPNRIAFALDCVFLPTGGNEEIIYSSYKQYVVAAIILSFATRCTLRFAHTKTTSN